MLYEMLAGEPPLTGATPQMTHARRLTETPTHLHTLRDTVPPALDHVIARALAKIPADRYATASQFGQALQAVLFAATPAAHADLSMTPGPLATTPTTVGAEPEGRSRRWWLLAVPALGIGLVIAAAMLWPPSGWLGESSLQITVSNIRPVTSEPGLEFQPAISPDGSEVAYVVGPVKNSHIVVRSAIQVGSGETRPGAELSGLHWLPAWTPGGASLRFLACSPGSGCNWKVGGKLGGAVRTLSVPRSSSCYAWSHDGSRVAFVVRDSIYTYSTDSPDPELVGVQIVAPAGLHSLSWSPDGRWIAYVNGNAAWRNSANISTASIWILDADGGEPVAVSDEVDMNLSPQWLPDSRHLLFVSDRDGARGVYVVEVGPAGPIGPPRSVLPSSDPHSISISQDGRRLAYAAFTARQNIWSIPIPRSGSVSIREAVPVTEGNQVIEVHSLSPDGAWIVFDNNIQGKLDIYKAPLDGGPHQPQLVAEIAGNAFAPDWSPDGAEIAVYAWRPEGAAGQADILVVSVDGGTPEQLTDFPGVSISPNWSPDGLAIAFPSQGPNGISPFKIWVVSRNGAGMPWADPVQLTDFGCRFPDWAPDGLSLVCLAGGGKLARVSRDGEVLVRYDPSAAGLRSFSIPQFSLDGMRIYFRGTHEDGSEGMWWIPANGGAATKVVAIDDPSLTVGYMVTVGRENLYFTIPDHESDIWAMDLDW